MNTAYTKVYTVTLKKKDVFYDIDMLSLYYSEITGGGDLAKENRVATETDATGGNRIITRLCDHRVSDLRQHLAKFINNETAAAANDMLDNGDWEISLRVSTEAEDNTLSPLTDLMHDYVVNGALTDYYVNIGVTGNIESLRKRMDEDLARIRELIYHRPMP